MNTGTTLNLFSVSTDDAGVYQCTAGSSRGTVNAQATLTVLCKSSLSLLGGYVFESPAIITSSVKPSSQYGKNTRRAFDTTLKHKDRIDFYLCIADAPVDVSDRTCHKFIAVISCVIIVRNLLNA